MGSKTSKHCDAAEDAECKLPEHAGEYETLMAGKLVAPADLSGDLELAALASDLPAGGSRPGCIKAVMKELRAMRRNLPVNVASTTFVRYDKAKPNLMKVLIVGPAGTPYDGGCFVFNVACPPDYPAHAPRVKLETTGGGTVRFNPNLYTNGKVCLSLLGTWSGTGCENWSPTSTLLQVFVSITGLIMVAEPWYNEPGRESRTAPKSDLRNATNGGLNTIRAGTLRFAVADMYRNPPAAFADVVADHFRLRGGHVRAVAAAWEANCRKEGDGEDVIRAADVARAALDDTPVVAATPEPQVPSPSPAPLSSAPSPTGGTLPLPTLDDEDLLDMLFGGSPVPAIVEPDCTMPATDELATLELEVPMPAVLPMVNPTDLLELDAQAPSPLTDSAEWLQLEMPVLDSHTPPSPTAGNQRLVQSLQLETREGLAAKTMADVELDVPCQLLDSVVNENDLRAMEAPRRPSLLRRMFGSGRGAPAPAVPAPLVRAASG